jgi:hypothetical protein
MKNRWQKLGQLYTPQGTGRHPKLVSHAANPLPIHIEKDIYRIYYSGRDEKNRSSVGAVDIDILTGIIANDHYEPFFEHGHVGSFYADGVSIGSCYEINSSRFILFMGWQNPPNTHWRGDIGRLRLTQDLTLELANNTPILSRDLLDPISFSYPWIQTSSSGHFEMWYGSTLTWDAGNGEMLHVLHHATSDDGEAWVKKGLSVPYEIGKAQAFSKPSVLVDENGEYQMWFSYRGQTTKKYRIGHARSGNRINWTLDLFSPGIDISSSGWDSEMIEYPYIFMHHDKTYMLYNGNGYGLTGFGLAVLEKE